MTEQKKTTTGCLLVNLRLEAWTNHRKDADASVELAKSKGADASTTRVWKTLLPKSAALKQVNSALRAIRMHHYRNTLVYMHDGPRILPASNYLAYKTELRILQDKLEVAVNELVQQLHDLKAGSRAALGELYSEADYPSELDLRRAYGVQVQYAPMPNADNLMVVGIEENEAKELREKLEAELRDTYEAATRRHWEELYSRISVLQAQMNATEDGVPHPKTLEGLRSMAELLPRLNVTNDEKLNEMAQQLSKSLEGVSTGALSANPVARQRVASETKTMQSLMAALMAGPASSNLEFKRAA